ncbi:MAG: outer membrane lipoprotein-sorting protein [Balneolales bacterium]|nr:outer membrane lipoprotein-sorting protein [Balneolales bacterium]
MKTTPYLLILLAVALMLPQTTYAQSTNDEEAREIYEELDRRQRAVVYETATLNMRIVDNRGRTRERDLDIWSFNSDDTQKTLVRFNAPADVRGTGLLTISESGEEVQRLFLPALNRIQTISSSQRSDRFMGSDFTYEDMGDQNPDDFDFTVISKDSESNIMVVKGVRTAPASYAYAHFEINTERYVLMKATYFDDSDTEIRELTTENIVEITTDVWRANKLTMRDIKANRYTVLEWKSRSIDEPIADVIFTERNLQRPR